MPWWLIGLLVYGAVALLALRPVAGALAWRMHRIGRQQYPSLYGRRSEPTGEQWFGGVMFGAAICAIWPLAIAFVLQGRKDSWVVGAERIARLEQRERRVREMEKSLGIEERRT